MADVYISSSPRDAAAAQHIRKDLESKGISCSISSIDAAESPLSSNMIPIEIQSAKFFVVLVSRSSIASSIVKNELYWATEENCQIFPIRLDNASLNDTFHFFLGTKQWISAKRRLSAASKELCDVIWSELHHIPLKPLADTEDQEKKTLKDKKSIIIRAILCVVITTAFIVTSGVSFSLLRKYDIDLYWSIDFFMSLATVVALFFVMAPLFGGYKVFLRTLLEGIRDMFRGE